MAASTSEGRISPTTFLATGSTKLMAMDRKVAKSSGSSDNSRARIIRYFLGLGEVIAAPGCSYTGLHGLQSAPGTYSTVTSPLWNAGNLFHSIGVLSVPPLSKKCLISFNSSPVRVWISIRVFRLSGISASHSMVVMFRTPPNSIGGDEGEVSVILGTYPSPNNINSLTEPYAPYAPARAPVTS